MGGFDEQKTTERSNGIAIPSQMLLAARLELVDHACGYEDARVRDGGSGRYSKSGRAKIRKESGANACCYDRRGEARIANTDTPLTMTIEGWRPRDDSTGLRD